MSFPRYSSYKDSGVEWLGEVPGHWKAVPIKHLGRLKGGAGFPHENQGIYGEELSFHKVNALAQADSDGYLAKSENTIDRATAKELGAFVFPPDSIVFAKVGAALLLGRIRMLNQDACLDNNMMGLVIRENEFHAKFVRHAMNLVRFDLIANPGAVPSLNEGQIGYFRLPMPPLPEQNQIAEFLDRETAKIDELVAEQRRLMELLKEKRQAVISYAVTQGMNPDAPMKPSGIEWLGDVPAHWDIIPLSKMADWDGGLFLDGDWIESVDISEDGIRYLTSGNVGEGEYKEQGQGFITQAKFDELKCTEVVPGDILISRLNLPAGRACLVPELGGKIVTCVDNVIFRPKQSYDRRYLMYVFSTKQHFANTEILARGATMQRISRSRLGGIRFALPPRKEQVAILRYLSDELGAIDGLTAEAQRAIDLLQERRTALISAAVTGQIDVRRHTGPSINPDNSLEKLRHTGEGRYPDD